MVPAIQPVRPWINPNPLNLDVAYTWDNQGRMTSMRYPGDQQAYTHQYDAMGRPSTMSGPLLNLAGNDTLSAGASWGPAGELLSLTGSAGSWNPVSFNENFTYNSLGQLTQMSGSLLHPQYIPISLQYVYPAGQNNGRISQMIDGITGDNVSYTYDALNRLTGATAGSWSQSYSYDGWGTWAGPIHR